MVSAITTDRAPKAVGPYSQGIATEKVVFLSEQIGIDPVTQQLAEGGVEAQTRQIFLNIAAVLFKAGLDFRDIVKVNIYI
jgi:2-iminobutanoate/2-iminopropanoate deaminase